MDGGPYDGGDVAIARGRGHSAAGMVTVSQT